MSSCLAYADLVLLLTGGARRLKENRDLLTRLDSAIGDGDHGVTIERIADAMLGSIDGCPVQTPGPLLQVVGWNVLSVDGGSAGPLFGSLFLGMAEAAGGSAELDAPALAAAFAAGLARLRAQTAAAPGDKTMLDALLPAVDSLRQGAAEGLSLPQLFSRAAEAAAQGAEATKQFQARYGRARNLGPRSVGHLDPGAVSISLLFAGFRDGLPACTPHAPREAGKTSRGA